jgi:hypothetical protein
MMLDSPCKRPDNIRKGLFYFQAWSCVLHTQLFWQADILKTMFSVQDSCISKTGFRLETQDGWVMTTLRQRRPQLQYTLRLIVLSSQTTPITGSFYRSSSISSGICSEGPFCIRPFDPSKALLTNSLIYEQSLSIIVLMSRQFSHRGENRLQASTTVRCLSKDRSEQVTLKRYRR